MLENNNFQLFLKRNSRVSFNEEGVIYCLTSPEGKRYVGQTCNSLRKRCRQHAIQTIKKNFPISHAIKKYGIENFKVRIVKKGLKTQGELDFYEIKYIAQYKLIKNGYNCSKGGRTGGVLKHTDERRNYWAKKQRKNNNKIKAFNKEGLLLESENSIPLLIEKLEKNHNIFNLYRSTIHRAVKGHFLYIKDIWFTFEENPILPTEEELIELATLRKEHLNSINYILVEADTVVFKGKKDELYLFMKKYVSSNKLRKSFEKVSRGLYNNLCSRFEFKVDDPEKLLIRNWIGK